MKKVDFLLTYEVKIREIEYLELLRYELEHRGYSAVLVPANALWGRGVKYHAEVIINAGFREDRINSGTGVVFNKALELTSEQILSEYKIKNLKPRGRLKDYVMINAWGKNAKDRFVNVEKVPEARVVAYGHPILDYCKKRFVDYYYSRHEIAKKYNLDEKCKWNLFLSTFTEKNYSNNKNYYALNEIKKNTLEELIIWFEKIIENYNDQIIIYRPHPVEEIRPQLIELEKKYHNFRIIRDLGVRQWIANCDKSYTWFSTSSIEAYFMDKPIYFLRPYLVPKEFDAQIFLHPEKAVDNFEDFCLTIQSDNKIEKFDFFDESINDYYAFDKDSYVYEKLADLCEHIYSEEEFIIPHNINESIYMNSVNNWKKLKLHQKFALFMRGLPIYSIYHDLFSPNVDYMNLRKGELRNIDERLSKCLNEIR